MTVVCIDVSSNNGTIDWPQVAAAGVHIAIAKCSEGSSSSYPSFPRNWTGIAAARIGRRGAYHFADARSSPTANGNAAAHALASLGGLVHDDFLALDVERLSQSVPWPLTPGPQTISWTLETLAAMEQLTGRRPWLYCSSGWLSGMLHSDPRLKPYPLWIANINAGPIATPWPYALRQFTWTAHVPGIGGNVDGSELGPAYTGHVPPSGGSNPMYAPNQICSIYTDQQGHTWGLRPTGEVDTLGGTEFHGSYGTLQKTDPHRFPPRGDFAHITARPDGKAGYTLWPVNFTSPMQRFDFPIA